MFGSTVIHILVHSFELCIALGALYFAKRASDKSPVSLRRELHELELALADLEVQHAALHKSHRKLNSRVAMRQARAEDQERRADEKQRGNFTMQPGESEADWKKRCRAAIAEGVLKHEH